MRKTSRFEEPSAQSRSTIAGMRKRLARVNHLFSGSLARFSKVDRLV